MASSVRRSRHSPWMGTKLGLPDERATRRSAPGAPESVIKERVQTGESIVSETITITGVRFWDHATAPRPQSKQRGTRLVMTNRLFYRYRSLSGSTFLAEKNFAKFIY